MKSEAGDPSPKVEEEQVDSEVVTPTPTANVDGDGLIIEVKKEPSSAEETDAVAAGQETAEDVEMEDAEKQKPTATAESEKPLASNDEASKLEEVTNKSAQKEGIVEEKDGVSDVIMRENVESDVISASNWGCAARSNCGDDFAAF